MQTLLTQRKKDQQQAEQWQQLADRQIQLQQQLSQQQAIVALYQQWQVDTEQLLNIQNALQQAGEQGEKVRLEQQQAEQSSQQLQLQHSGYIAKPINIDNLLEKAYEIPITTHVKALIPDRQLLHNNKRKAPFHSKIDSVKDAYIIFSTLEYLKEEQVNQLLFISENKNDFGNPKNKNREIHSDISSDYPSIQIDYYSDIFFAINEYKKEMPILDGYNTSCIT